MLYIDISKGVTFTLLLKAIACYDSNFLQIVSQSIQDTPVYPEYLSYLHNALKQKSTTDFCRVLSDTVFTKKAIDISSLKRNDPFIDFFSKKIQKSAPGFLLDPLEICIYISLTGCYVPQKAGKIQKYGLCYLKSFLFATITSSFC